MKEYQRRAVKGKKAAATYRTNSVEMSNFDNLLYVDTMNGRQV